MRDLARSATALPSPAAELPEEFVGGLKLLTEEALVIVLGDGAGTPEEAVHVSRDRAPAPAAGGDPARAGAIADERAQRDWAQILPGVLEQNEPQQAILGAHAQPSDDGRPLVKCFAD